ncbi:MAG: VCBS repeat-containing protein [Deltaproteobacteria bacterium]|nr:VCBS repeat-containing protein [Deltaproteobacteria bacterium]
MRSIRRSFYVADIDGDGFLDFVSFGDNQYSVHYGLGDGSLSPGTAVASALCDDPRDMTVGDVDDDGKVDDVIFISRNFSGSHNFRSDGGRPTPPLTNVQQFVPSNAVFASSAGRLGDVDGDGILDVVLANDGFTGVGPTLGNGQLAFQRGNGDGTFAPGVVASDLTGRALGNVELADLDDDGALDAVALGVASGPVVFFGDGAGRFPTIVTLPPPAGVAGTTRVAIGDFTADGLLDIVTLDDVRVVFYAGTAARSFGVPFSRTLPSAAFSVAMGDVDGDGLDDVVTSHFNTRTFNVLLSRPAP